MREIKWNLGGGDPLSILLQDKVVVGGRFSWRPEDGGAGSTQSECVHFDLRIK